MEKYRRFFVSSYAPDSNGECLRPFFVSSYTPIVTASVFVLSPSRHLPPIVTVSAASPGVVKRHTMPGQSALCTVDTLHKPGDSNHSEVIGIDQQRAGLA